MASLFLFTAGTGSISDLRYLSRAETIASEHVSEAIQSGSLMSRCGHMTSLSLQERFYGTLSLLELFPYPSPLRGKGVRVSLARKCAQTNALCACCRGLAPPIPALFPPRLTALPDSRLALDKRAGAGVTTEMFAPPLRNRGSLYRRCSDGYWLDKPACPGVRLGAESGVQFDDLTGAEKRLLDRHLWTESQNRSPLPF